MAALLAIALNQVAVAAQEDPLQLLIEQGKYWQSRGDYQRATEAWEKLLRADPGQPDALYGMAMAAAAGNRQAEAQRYLAQLRQAAPQSPYVGQIEQALALDRPGAAGVLEEARQAAQAGQPEQAIARYDQALAGAAPQGQLGLEYYQTLGATDEGWERGRRGLEQLVRQNPDNAQMRLALAQLLSYREATRTQAVEQLAELAQRPDVGAAARQSWRQAILWLGETPEPRFAPMLQTYVRANPDDAEIKQRLARAQQSSPTTASAGRAAAPANPLTARARAAFDTLDAGRIDVAEREFEDMLRAAPTNADALGGLGVVRLRQQRFVESRDLLQRATRQGSAARWRQALNSATYWANLNDANTARNAGNLAQARKLLADAVRLDPAEPTGQNALAAVQAESGQLGAAEKTYRQVLARQPGNVDAIRGLVGVLSQGGDSQEALQLIGRLTPEQQAQVGDLGRLRAAEATGRARAASARGDDAAAATALQDALLSDPTNAWIRLDLARLYLKVGALQEARGVVDGLLQSNPDMPDALYASALLSAETQDWNGALARLDRIPQQERTTEMGELQRRAWVHAQTAYAGGIAKQGQKQQALAVLAQVAPYAENDTELLGALASAYAEAGDSNRALGMMRQLLARGAKPDPGLQLQYAGILLATGQDVELAGVLRQLQSAELERRQLDTYEDIRRVYIVRQADALRQRGQLADAYDMLAPALAERPDDAAAVGALARLYADSGDARQALDIYKQLLQHRPDDTEALAGAADMAAQAGDYRYAQASVERALAGEPNNPELLSTAARIYRAQGRNSKAEEVLKRAIALQAPTRTVAYAPGGVSTTPANGNPFRNRSPSAQAPAPYAAYAASQTPAGGYVAQPYIPAPVTGNVLPQQAGAPYYAPPGGVPGQWTQGAPAGYAGQPAYPQQSAPYPAAQAPAPYYAPPQQPYAPAPYPAAPYPGQPQPGYPANPWVPGPGGSLPGQAAANAPQTLQQQLADVQADRSGDIAMGANVRARDGEGGMSQVTDIQVPLEARLPVGDGKFALRVTPTSLSTDGMGTDFNTHSRFGGGPSAALAQQSGSVGGPGSQDASGVGVAVAYQGRNLSADIGSTPLGFRETNVVGGVRAAGKLGDSNVDYAVSLSRRAVTDSILSFAGARDARTGQTWGGVTATGGRVQLGMDGDDYGIYGYGGFHHLGGRNVASNRRVEGGFGVYAKLINEMDRELTAGLNFTGFSYDKNLRYFTYGHGGYFSPQRFFSVSLPVNWTQRSGRLSYYVRGALGIQNFREDSALYFPTDGGLQSSAQAAMAAANAAGLTTNSQAIYAGQTKTGLGYNLAAAAEYQLAPQLYLGGSLALDNARDYEQYAGGVYLRYLFVPSTRTMPMPVTPFGSPYEGNN
ncbi:tetratricopeptide repeat protein [Verticiella sediminum]|uniref:Tetratricopeptide repeat protein n=2 Tax=Verticiella sediminum TaxID=1247510 RepID=A0A556AZ27_9BURK|nr:tetratricopeptide repeat protein [Verticiella sediminum]